MAGLLSLTAFRQDAGAAEVNADGYDLSGFAYRFPEKFTKDNTVTITEDSYQSHNVNIQLSRHFIGRLNGDADENLKVDIQDAVACCRILCEQTAVPFTAEGIMNADCNNDDAIDLLDLSLLLDYLSGNLTSVEFFTNPTITYHVADIYIRDINSLRGAFAKGTFPEKGSAQLESITKMAVNNNSEEIA